MTNTGRFTSSEGPFHVPDCCHSPTGRERPSSSFPEHPACQRVIGPSREGWSLPRSAGPTKALAPTPLREERYLPEHQGAFHCSEPHAPRLPVARWIDASMTPPPPAKGGRHCNRWHQRLFLRSLPPDPDGAKQKERLDPTWPSVVLGFARADRSAPQQFLQSGVLSASKIWSAFYEACRPTSARHLTP